MDVNGTGEQPRTSGFCANVGEYDWFTPQLPFACILLLCIINATASVLSIVGNFLILAVIWRTPSLHSPANVLLSGLALTDLGVGLMVQPLWVLSTIAEIHRNCRLFSTGATLLVLLSHLFIAASLLTLTAISIERLLALSLHLRYNLLVTKARVYVFFGVMWPASIVYSIISIFRRKPYNAFKVAVISIIAVTIISCNFKIFQIVRRHQVQIQVQVAVTQPSGRSSITRHGKSAFTTLYIVAFFLLTYLPRAFHLGSAYFISNKTDSYFLVNDFLLTIFYLNSCLNPFLYCWRIRQLRDNLKETVKTFLRTSSSEITNDPKLQNSHFLTAGHVGSFPSENSSQCERSAINTAVLGTGPAQDERKIVDTPAQ